MDSAADTAAVALSAATTALTLATRIWRQWEPRTARWRIGHVIAARLPSAPDLAAALHAATFAGKITTRTHIPLE